MSKRMVVCLMLAVSACVGEEASEQADEQDALTAAESQNSPVAHDARTCKLASRLGLGERAVQSCEAAAPVDGAGEIATSPRGTVITQACTTYTGICTGISGCSRVVAEGWEWTVCGSWVSASMTICDGRPVAWGSSFCL